MFTQQKPLKVARDRKEMADAEMADEQLKRQLQRRQQALPQYQQLQPL